MKNEQINIAIAEACGWSGQRFDHIKQRLTWGLPDCCNDLNAMHEAEKVLTLSQREVYQQWLYRICEREHRMAPIYWLAITATARQRAEAFLRTIGKWEEEAK
jgi:hypothetical protein